MSRAASAPNRARRGLDVHLVLTAGDASTAAGRRVPADRRHRGHDRPVSTSEIGPTGAWYPACWSERLRRRPVAGALRGRPLVLFRGADGAASALVDRCPHRSAPLSAGRVGARGLECGYHGWTFDGEGRCVHVPGLVGEPDAKGRRAQAHAARERDGLVFVWGAPGEEPEGEPPAAPHEGDRSFTTLRHEIGLQASLRDAIENVLDVPHTAVLHRGLFRSGSRPHPITAVVRRRRGGVEAEFLGEPRPTGLAGRVLAPRGGVVTHVDRFAWPATAQVEYAIGDDVRLVSTSFLLPEGPRRTRLFAVIRYRAGLPGRLLLPVIAPIAWLILRQDARMLAATTRNLERCGGGRRSSTELDLLGADVARLLRDGPSEPPDEPERRVTFRA
jgi:phenylpropionate dioxygenase-like ring-hydroxylating dioxygenase large terminal subunit